MLLILMHMHVFLPFGSAAYICLEKLTNRVIIEYENYHSTLALSSFLFALSLSLSAFFCETPCRNRDWCPRCTFFFIFYFYLGTTQANVFPVEDKHNKGRMRHGRQRHSGREAVRGLDIFYVLLGPNVCALRRTSYSSRASLGRVELLHGAVGEADGNGRILYPVHLLSNMAIFGIHVSFRGRISPRFF